MDSRKLQRLREMAEGCLCDSLDEEHYPDALPDAERVRNLLGKFAGGALSSASDICHERASKDDPKGSGHYWNDLAGTIDSTIKILQRKAWAYLLPLLDPKLIEPKKRSGAPMGRKPAWMKSAPRVPED